MLGIIAMQSSICRHTHAELLLDALQCGITFTGLDQVKLD